MNNFKKVLRSLVTSALGGIILFGAGLLVDKLKDIREKETLEETVRQVAREEMKRLLEEKKIEEK